MDDDWRRRAACFNLDTNIFFPPDLESVPQEAAQICAVCPVREECLEYAISTRQDWGVYGGMSPKQRRRLRRNRQRAGEPVPYVQLAARMRGRKWQEAQ